MLLLGKNGSGTMSIQHANMIADKKVGTKLDCGSTYTVYALGAVNPRIIQRGLSLEEAKKLAEEIIKNGTATRASIVQSLMLVRVIHTYRA
jgi:hypothetical protein